MAEKKLRKKVVSGSKTSSGKTGKVTDNPTPAKVAPKMTKTRKTAKVSKPKSSSPVKSKYGKRFLDEITKDLVSMRDSLLKGVSRSIQHETNNTNSGVGDFYDKASDDRERILSLTFSERERQKLKQIEDALARVRDGTYGICEMTGEKIGEDRLRVMPFAKFTIEAQEEIEKS